MQNCISTCWNYKHDLTLRNLISSNKLSLLTFNKCKVSFPQVYCKSVYFVLTSADWDLFVQQCQPAVCKCSLLCQLVCSDRLPSLKRKIKSWCMTLSCLYYCWLYRQSQAHTHSDTHTQTQLWFEGIHDDRVLQTSGDLLAATHTHIHSLCHDLYGKDKDIGDKSLSAIQQHTHTHTPTRARTHTQGFQGMFFFWQRVSMFDAKWNCLTLLDLSQVLSPTVCVCAWEREKETVCIRDA